jgi:hypothetical protein
MDDRTEQECIVDDRTEQECIVDDRTEQECIVDDRIEQECISCLTFSAAAGLTKRAHLTHAH